MRPTVLDYDRMVEDALKDVLVQALRMTEQHGLPGEHYFYITFRTDCPDVEIPERLRRDHPDEMTIILQHQFWDLEVDGTESFSVTLSFNNIDERIVVPFAAVTAFADPYAKFGLQFQFQANGGETAPLSSATDEQPFLDADDAETASDLEGEDPETDDDEDDAEKVVTLDAFRKK